MKMLKSLPELMILIKGMLQAMTSVAYVMGLLVIITYVFAIAFTQLAVGTPSIGDVYFTNVPLSMYSLLIHATFCDDLSGFTNALREEMWPLLVFALIFICLAALTVMNMLIGVLCEVVAAVAETEKEQILTDNVCTRLADIATKLDENFDSKISYEEFSRIVEVPDALSALQEVGVNPEGIVDFAELFFFEDGQSIELTFDAFMEMVLDLRESNTATVKDILNLWKQIKENTNSAISDNMTAITALDKKMDSRIEALNKKVDDSTNRIESQFEVVLRELRVVSSQLPPHLFPSLQDV
jgi:hypothetical protein